MSLDNKIERLNKRYRGLARVTSRSMIFIFTVSMRVIFLIQNNTAKDVVKDESRY